MMKRSYIFITLLYPVIFLSIKPAGASDPSLARYSDDPSNIFWFIQVADTHIDNDASADEITYFEWVLNESVAIVDPLFVVNTGDLVDHSEGLCYWCGIREEEWTLYRNITDSAGMTDDFYFDIVGNHDTYADEDASYYLDLSIQGHAQGTTQPHWRFDLPFGSYHFFSIATTCNDWLGWPADNNIVTEEEYDEILRNLDANTDTNLTIGVGHHDYYTYLSTSNAEQVDYLLSTYNVPLYIHGHEHSYGVRLSDRGVIRAMASSLGKKQDEHYCVWAVDSDALSHTCVPAHDPWPMVIITAPVDALLGVEDETTNPYAPYVPPTLTEAPIRVLAFDAEPITSLNYVWDTGATGSFEQSGEIHGQWLATFDSTAFTEGIHDLTVEATGSMMKDFTIQVVFGEEPIVEEEPEGPVEKVTEPAAEDEEAPETADTDVSVDAPIDAFDDEDEEGSGDVSGGGCSC